MLEVLPAKKGDCLLLHCGTAARPALVLVDGGPAGVWDETLLPRLLELRAARRLAKGEPLVIDLVVVSHVDDDHINGVVALFRHMKDQAENKKAPDFAVGRLWHNSFDDVVAHAEERAAGSNRYGAASLGAEVEDELEDGPTRDVAMVLASVAQGDELRRLAGALHVPVNPEFDGGVIEAGAPLDVDPALGLEIVVAGPMHVELEELRRDFAEWHDRRKKAGGRQTLLAALDDESVANLSSIVLLVRDATGSILLTGDARSDKVLEGLELAGAVAPGATLAVDILKMPHHGSIRNIDEPFIRRVPADRYVFSGDGEHGNPDRETFDLLFGERPGATMTMRLTYPLDEIDTEREREHVKEQRKRERRGKPAGPDWNRDTHALAAVLSPPPAGVTLAFDD